MFLISSIEIPFYFLEGLSLSVVKNTKSAAISNCTIIDPTIHTTGLYMKSGIFPELAVSNRSRKFSDDIHETKKSTNTNVGFTSSESRLAMAGSPLLIIALNIIGTVDNVLIP